MAKKKTKNKKKVEVKAEKIQVENVPEVKLQENAPEEQPQQSEQVVGQTPEDKRTEFLAKTIDRTAEFVLNQTYLQKREKVTISEVEKAHFGQSMAELIDYYFPDWSFDHPLVAAGTSLSILIMVCASKKLLEEEKSKDDKQGNSKGKTKQDHNKVDGKIPNKSPDSGLGKGRSPYADLPRA